ncbi:hypothetical protein ACEN9X_13265 [Mucilaginibacter sp. Mucisp86]|uniref:hypothetical protein n=1 Tax=Mucilaginibacter sp. Mucisp86 TaxID=3243060 RepID=UPI0039B36A6C
MKKLIAILCLTVATAGVAKAQAKIYGGKHYDQFLGCMECDSQTPNSIWSPFSDYGSSHNPKSIWNERGLYGSVKSNYSPYNPKAKYPPRVVDKNGKCLGYLTVNKDNPKRFGGSVADLICFSRDTVLRDGVDTYGQQFEKVN